MRRREQSGKSGQLRAPSGSDGRFHDKAIDGFGKRIRKMLAVVGWAGAGALVLSVMIVGGVAQATAGGAEKAQPARAMATDAHPVFEVAAIKPSDPNESANGFHAEGRQIFIKKRR